MANRTLRTRIGSLRRRLTWIGAASGLVWGLIAAVIAVLVAAWLDLLWELSPQWRIALATGAAAVGLALLAAFVAATLRSGRDGMMARRLDRAAGSGGQILTGLELDQPVSAAVGTAPAELRAGLAEMAVGQAAALAVTVPAAKAVPVRPLGRSLGWLIVVAVAVAVLVLLLPGLAQTQWNRFRHPFGDVPPFSQTELLVEPGDTEVLYGGELDIHVTAEGEPVDTVELVLQRADADDEHVPMFPEPDGRWRAVLAKVTEPATYHARAYRARSPHYQIGVITVPRIEEVQVRIAPPAYTGRAPYEGPMPKGGIAGLADTQVRVTAGSNRRLSGGRITLAPVGDPADGKTPDPIEIAMQPLGEHSQQVAGSFEIARDGKFELRVIDTDGQPSREAFAGSVTLLSDQRPFVRLLQPKERSLATPNTAIPVVISAEDDYGISRVELFRSLNDSRAIPMDVRVAKTSRRVYETIYLPLDRYGLEPGDVIKLFARVEDNDPSGAKGAESTVVQVEIISQEDFERLLQVREGMEVLMSKYRSARRRMEGLGKETEGLRKKMKDNAGEFPPEAKVTESTREQLRRLSKRLRREAEEIRKAADHKLPYDLDRNLASQMEQLAAANERMAQELDEMLDEANLKNERLAAHLNEMTNRLAGEQKKFDQQAMEPLEHFEKIFPLIADQARFIVLVLRQKDLAARMASLAGHDGEDSPALKARMRDLEEEQRTIREDLATLLDDIEDHVGRLPDDQRLDKLRETATKFVAEVRSSGAAEAMSEAEAALTEFAGTRAHEKAQEAADILSKFVKSCSSMGGAAGGCLAFQPALGMALGDSVSQMLGQLGLGNGSGFGMGAGAGGGYSARAMGRNMGLYGSMPGMTEAFGSGSGRDGRDADGPGHTLADQANPDEESLVEDSAMSSASGVGGGAVPIQYRRRVGQYFRRILEETGER